MSDWIEVGSLNDIPNQGARVVRTDAANIAVWRTASDEIFAVKDECPNKKGQLSQCIVFSTKVACPLHNLMINLDSGSAVAPDEGCAATYPIKMEGETIFLSVTPDEGCPNQ